ncbi:glycoside hydrolase domain-containing protein [Lacinutrix sp. Bg11-31]|uniref:glycoside hydrolase domain-containing protein n=1 Tax=Lacinutrix sp. Bg11-31 TaxID=2057808 RepID=UPI001E442F86|nr:glycoside hydrolase domain-containing protein [Lacinutrix sp. Bg11-31]
MLGNGNTLRIKATKQSKDHVYVKSVSVNGRVLKDNVLSHKDIIGGGEIVFEMHNLY